MAQFTIKIADELKRKVEAQAKENGRSRTKEIERILQEYFQVKSK